MTIIGYLQAVYDLGLLSRDSNAGTQSNEMSSFLQWPMRSIDDEEKRDREIRVWLRVEDIAADSLNVLGVEKIDPVEYPYTVKELYLYREPVGSAATWKFSPIYKLGKGVSEGLKELVGLGSEEARTELEEWLLGSREEFSSKDIQKEIKNNRFFKLKNTLLNDFENEGAFEPGSVNRIMKYLLTHINDIAKIWADAKRSYILVFGLSDGQRFIYPGEVIAFQKYFASKLQQHVIGGNSKENASSVTCAICEADTTSPVTVDKLFAFATFDKSNFLPGTKDGYGVKEKVYPICQNCFSVFCDGREKIKSDFRDSQTVPGLYIDVVPELVFGIGRLKKIGEETGLFIKKGITREEKRFNKLAEQGDGLVYHFFFWEQNQKQERIHLLVEDVPPTRLKGLLKKWQETVKLFLAGDDEPDETNRSTLDWFFKTSYGSFMSLAGKRDEDKKVMRNRWLSMAGNLLSGKNVDTYWLKSLMVSRFPGLFADQDWVKRFGRYEMKRMTALVEFFERTNGR